MCSLVGAISNRPARLVLRSPQIARDFRPDDLPRLPQSIAVSNPPWRSPPRITQPSPLRRIDASSGFVVLWRRRLAGATATNSSARMRLVEDFKQLANARVRVPL